jgi:hypothetical protein
MTDTQYTPAKSTTQTYRLQGNHLFLSYPRCTLTHEQALNALNKKAHIDQYVIAIEPHEDGYPHIHAYLKLTKRCNYSSARCLDIEGYHGNYQKCKNNEAVKRYCKKKEDYITNIIGFQPIAAAIRVIQAESNEEAMHIVKGDKDLARDMLRDSARYESSIARLHPTYTAPVLKYRFITMQSVMRWKRKRHALWLVGPTGTGKTEFAKTLFTKALFITHIDKLKLLSQTHDGLIFDDMNFKHWPREAQIHITDIENDRDINVKHGMMTIPKGLPRIFISNVPIFMLDPAIKRRLRIIRVKEDLRLLQESVIDESDDSTNSNEPIDADFQALTLQ